MDNNKVLEPIYKDYQTSTMPWQEITSVTKSVVVDSRQRDSSVYKSPSFYTINFENKFKNVSSIELKGAIIPKTSYNVHSSNCYIDFSIGTSITKINVIYGGKGYIGIPTVLISSPKNPGITATASVSVNSNGVITSVNIINPGSGYSPDYQPVIIINGNQVGKYSAPRFSVIVGTHYTAKLRTGEYEIGGNPIPGTTTMPTGLLLEIQNSLNFAVNGGNYNPVSSSPFAVRVVSQYPELGPFDPTDPNSFDTNACLFNRIQIVNVNSDPFFLLFGSGPNKMLSAESVLGFNSVDTNQSIPVLPVNTPLGNLIPGGTAIRASFDYNLNDDPCYVIMSIQLGRRTLDRLKSKTDDIDDMFAVLLFDNNDPNSLHDLSFSNPGSIISVDGVKQLIGQTGKGTFWRKSGKDKPIKGQDYDIKKLIFKPDISVVEDITIRFTKYGSQSGGELIEYNMEGREHCLLFEFTSTNQQAGRKE